jgi:hypothetical protein
MGFSIDGWHPFSGGLIGDLTGGTINGQTVFSGGLAGLAEHLDEVAQAVNVGLLGGTVGGALNDLVTALDAPVIDVAKWVDAHETAVIAVVAIVGSVFLGPFAYAAWAAETSDAAVEVAVDADVLLDTGTPLVVGGSLDAGTPLILGGTVDVSADVATDITTGTDLVADAESGISETDVSAAATTTSGDAPVADSGSLGTSGTSGTSLTADDSTVSQAEADNDAANAAETGTGNEAAAAQPTPAGSTTSTPAGSTTSTPAGTSSTSSPFTKAVEKAVVGTVTSSITGAIIKSVVGAGKPAVSTIPVVSTSSSLSASLAEIPGWAWAAAAAAALFLAVQR